MGRIKQNKPRRPRTNPQGHVPLAPVGDERDFLAGFQQAIEFAFIEHPDDGDLDAIDVELVRRVSPCTCGRLELDGANLDRASLARVSQENRPNARALLLAALDYAHRTYGCAGQAAVIHEISDHAPAEGEPAELTALHRSLMSIHAIGTPCKAVTSAFT